MKAALHRLSVLLLLAAPAAVQAQFSYFTNNGAITIVGYVGTGGAVAISNFVSSIGTDSFYECTNLTSLTIPNSVTSIGEGAFYYCTNLASVVISGSVISIEPYAFQFAGLTSLTIPSSVTSIGNGAFSGCPNLTSIMVDASNASYCSLNGVLFDKGQITLLQYPGGMSGSYTIPGSVTSIGEGAFYDCTNLTSVSIPNSVTSVGGTAFLLCTGLTNITIPGGVTNIGAYAFEDSRNLTSVFFDGNPPGIGPAAFGFDTLTIYYLPGTSGWSSPFGGCPAALWNPTIQTDDGSFGLSNNQFGFNITGTTNIPIIVEGCTNLASPVWTPLQTLTLTNGSFYFSDGQWTNYPGRFYRISSP